MKEKIIRGKRVYLRPPIAEDFEELDRLYNTSRRLHRGLVSANFNRKDLDDLIGRNQGEDYESFLICVNEINQIAGTITLSQIFRKAFQNAFLGYLLGESFTGKGYMTEAVALILIHAFSNLKLHRIEANVQPHNAPSINVLKRCGFRKEGFSPKYLKIAGRWRDHERWAIVIEDWKSQKKK
ncbi:MAG: GNAT family N-acetyltransferase [Acidobacteriota bacterium]|jgi:ribosomal-protein-alanine N-acetyltransferase|nr:GNAT family N-acetyltransferase [Acidobacteriota bacterium]